MTEPTQPPPPTTPPPTTPPARRRLLTRRKLLAIAAGSGAAGGLAWWLLRIPVPARLDDLRLSDAARALVAKAWEGLDATKVVDTHCHVLGLGVGGTGCFVHPDTHAWSSPLRRLKARFYKAAAGIHDDERADALFVERLVDLVSHQQPRCKAMLLAFDKHHAADGSPDLARTEFHVPNDYVLGIAARWPELFLAACSVHPYRKDAADELRRCRALGAKACKWLPNAMGIDPLDPRCDPFYEALAATGMPLLTHAGEEQAVHAEEAQELGNPLRVRRALEKGCTVIVAHTASLGSSRDLDAPPDAAGERPKVSCHELFRRLLAEPRWQGRLFGDISATAQFNRCHVLPGLLRDEQLHARLVNGSDYPLPAIDPLVRTGLLVEQGLLDPAERPALNELYAYDPLTFDLVLKRRLRVVEPDGRQRRFSPVVFESGRVLPA